MSLKEYIEARLVAAEKVTGLASCVVDAKLERLRADIDDACADIEALEQYRARLEGKADQSALMGVLILSILGLVVSVVSLVAGFLR